MNFEQMKSLRPATIEEIRKSNAKVANDTVVGLSKIIVETKLLNDAHAILQFKKILNEVIAAVDDHYNKNVPEFARKTIEKNLNEVLLSADFQFIHTEKP